MLSSWCSAALQWKPRQRIFPRKLQVLIAVWCRLQLPSLSSSRTSLHSGLLVNQNKGDMKKRKKEVKCAKFMKTSCPALLCEAAVVSIGRAVVSCNFALLRVCISNIFQDIGLVCAAKSVSAIVHMVASSILLHLLRFFCPNSDSLYRGSGKAQHLATDASRTRSHCKLSNTDDSNQIRSNDITQMTNQVKDNSSVEIIFFSGIFNTSKTIRNQETHREKSKGYDMTGPPTHRTVFMKHSCQCRSWNAKTNPMDSEYLSIVAFGFVSSMLCLFWPWISHRAPIGHAVFENKFSALFDFKFGCVRLELEFQ